MKKDQPYIDPNGEVWITPAQVAKIWNERVGQQGGEANYTRWSVHKRREKLKKIDTPLGTLFSEKEAKEIRLRPHPKRPDVAERNKSRKRDPSPES